MRFQFRIAAPWRHLSYNHCIIQIRFKVFAYDTI